MLKAQSKTEEKQKILIGQKQKKYSINLYEVK